MVLMVAVVCQRACVITISSMDATSERTTVTTTRRKKETEIVIVMSRKTPKLAQTVGYLSTYVPTRMAVSCTHASRN